jgi:hypothetical protein
MRKQFLTKPLEKGYLKNHVFGSVSDPDWIRIQLGQGIRIQEGQNWPTQKNFQQFELLVNNTKIRGYLIFKDFFVQCDKYKTSQKMLRQNSLTSI